MKHILIMGDIGVGKSTLISRLLNTTTRPVCGFYTRGRETDCPGERDFFLHSALLPRWELFYTEENRIATCSPEKREFHPEVFDNQGVSCLQNLHPKGIVVMDELGFLESRSPQFQRRVLEVLDGDIPVLAAVKSQEGIPFLELVKAHPKAAVFRITPDNREELFAQLAPFIETL